MQWAYLSLGGVWPLLQALMARWKLLVVTRQQALEGSRQGRLLRIVDVLQLGEVELLLVQRDLFLGRHLQVVLVTRQDA